MPKHEIAKNCDVYKFYWKSIVREECSLVYFSELSRKENFSNLWLNFMLFLFRLCLRSLASDKSWKKSIIFSVFLLSISHSRSIDRSNKHAHSSHSTRVLRLSFRLSHRNLFEQAPMPIENWRIAKTGSEAQERKRRRRSPKEIFFSIPMCKYTQAHILMRHDGINSRRKKTFWKEKMKIVQFYTQMKVPASIRSRLLTAKETRFFEKFSFHPHLYPV